MIHKMFSYFKTSNTRETKFLYNRYSNFTPNWNNIYFFDGKLLTNETEYSIALSHLKCILYNSSEMNWIYSSISSLDNNRINNRIFLNSKL